MGGADGGLMMADRTVLVTGATGFIGRALVPALRARGWQVIAASRRAVPAADEAAGVVWRTCDLHRPETLPGALAGARVAFYLVHSMGGEHANFRERERHAATEFVAAAARAGVERIIYLGGPAPRGAPTEHLRSRLEVGEILRAGPVPTLELRASMVIGTGGASWQIVRDLAMRLPVMVLPRWLESRTRPIALDDVIAALVAAAELPLQEGSAAFDLPGPEVLDGLQILERIAALRGRRILTVKVPFLSLKLSALWLKLVTRTDFALARELVLGLREDLLPRDERFWGLIGHTKLLSFDEAARRALAGEPRRSAKRQLASGLAMLAVATAAWFGSFAALERLGTWTTFAVLGSALAATAVLSGAVPVALLRVSPGRIGMGVLAGMIMVALTNAGYALAVSLLPAVRAATAELFALLNVEGFSPAARSALVVVIAASEEVLFRGALPGTPAVSDEHRLRRLKGGDFVRVVAFALPYALATIPLGSVLLMACAFVCGIAWGAMRLATGSLVVPITTHVVWDLSVLVLWPLV